MFMHKSEVLRKRIKGGLEANEYSILNNLKIPEDIKEILEPYYWKWSLFSGNEIIFAGNFGKCRTEKNALCKNALSFFWGVWILRFMANGKNHRIQEKQYFYKGWIISCSCKLSFVGVKTRVFRLGEYSRCSVFTILNTYNFFLLLLFYEITKRIYPNFFNIL